MADLSTTAARRLALARAGLLKPDWTRMPKTARARNRSARRAAHRVVDRFGYLQLDTVSIAGARSHAIVLLSRMHDFDTQLAEQLLQPGEPLFEYWGHEASWIPMDLYPVFGFRRAEFRTHPWWGDLVDQHPRVARDLLHRIREHGPLRSVDMEGDGGRGWWDLKLTKKVATALWSSGELAIRERSGFQRTYDLAERVIPKTIFDQEVSRPDAVARLLLKALDGHGWATTGTLVRTWRFKNMQNEVTSALQRLCTEGTIIPCSLLASDGSRRRGWIQPRDLELAARLERARPRNDVGVLLSPFDPVLWDRQRVDVLFGFHQILEIFKPAAQRTYGYYCLPVLVGENLVGRCDLKAIRRDGVLQVLSIHHESGEGETLRCKTACRSAIEGFADALQLQTKY